MSFKNLCITLGIWGRNPSFFMIWGLAQPSPYVEPPLQQMCLYRLGLCVDVRKGYSIVTEHPELREVTYSGGSLLQRQ